MSTRTSRSHRAAQWFAATVILVFSATSGAQGYTAYGIPIGTPLNMAECPRTEVAGSVIYQLSPQPCRQNIFPKAGLPLDPDGGMIAFPPSQIPVGSSSNQIGLVLVEGRVGALVVSTPGIDSQQQIYDALVAKYGEPNEFHRLPVQSTLGAKFEAMVASWEKGDDLRISFVGAAGRIDTGELLIGTRSGLAERRARIDRALKSFSRPM